MNDLETLKGLEKLERLIRDGIERGEDLVRQAYRTEEVQQILQEMQESHSSLVQANQYIESLAPQVKELDKEIELAKKNLQVLDGKHSDISDRSISLEAKIQDLDAQITVAVTALDRTLEDRDKFRQELADFRNQLQAEKTAFLKAQETRLQQLQVDIDNSIQSQKDNYNTNQNLHDERKRQIDELAAQVSDRADRTNQLEDHLNSFIHDDLDNRLKTVETLVDDKEQAILESVYRCLERQARKYQILAAIAAIAAALLASLGQWHFRQNDNQTLPTHHLQPSTLNTSTSEIPTE